MKNFNKIITTIIFLTLGFLSLAGCASPNAVATPSATDNPQVAAIKNIRAVMGLPNLPLESKGMDVMSNSPSGGLSVAIYADSLGRKFSVEPQTNTVVEMDARDLLASVSAGAPAMSQDQLKIIALRIANATTPNFDSLSSNLTYSEGGKIDNYFFDWRAQASPGQMMPPFLQIAFHKSGFIFAYYNTISLKY
jgi:ABC-type Fe3+-hydroxamate transport system substrate-binding protein